ncbi:MAG: hypothetical protein AABZ01_04275 [Gemmatimonadota bacterium]
MPVLKTGYYACDECGDYFALDGGGVCRECQRILCHRHLHGSGIWWRRLLAKPRCARCRKGVAPQGQPPGPTERD